MLDSARRCAPIHRRHIINVCFTFLFKMSRRLVAELIHVWGAQSNFIALLQKQGMIQNDVSVSLKYYNMVFIWIQTKNIKSQDNKRFKSAPECTTMSISLKMATTELEKGVKALKVLVPFKPKQPLRFNEAFFRQTTPECNHRSVVSGEFSQPPYVFTSIDTHPFKRCA